MDNAHKSSNNVKRIAGILVSIAILTGAFFAVDAAVDKNKQPAPAQTQVQEHHNNVAPISYQGQDGQNALALLKSKHTVKTKEFAGIGEYVTEINGVPSDDGHFWSFYVNGKAAEVGAGSYSTKSTDTIEWKYEHIQ